MATRYLIAMDHVDLHAKKVIRKYAQNRPLGEIEKKYHYMVPQATLSTSVDIDRPGTGLSRPASTIDGGFRASGLVKSRKTNSAPATKLRRSEPSCGSSQQNQLSAPSINVSIDGRPATGIQRKPKPVSPAKPSYWRRPKTTGRLGKPPSTDGFMMIKIDSDILTSSRRRKELTNQIRDQWNDANHDVSFGRYVRGQGAENSGILGMSPRTGQWLTFSGPEKQDGQGVVDAFASLSGDGQNYSIDGHSGSRVAQQLLKGGRIRIGVNGDVNSKNTEKKITTEEERKEKQERARATCEEPPKAPPLCWTDQLSCPNAKIIRPRSPPLLKTIPILCETHPVVFQKLIPDDCPIPRLATPVRSCVYKGVKQRGKKLQDQLGVNNTTKWERNRGNGILISNIGTDRNSSDVSNTRDYSIITKNNDNKTEISISSSDSDTRIDQSMSKSDRKPSRGTGANSARRETPGSPKRLQKIKPSPASLQAYSSPDPELSITVTGSKPELTMSPRYSAGMSPRYSAGTVRSSSKVQSLYSGSSSSTSPSHTNMQAEFIHFSTGLITPFQRTKKSPQSSTSWITKVKEHNQHDVAFGDDVTTEKDSRAEQGYEYNEQFSKRPNTPVSPIPSTTSVHLSEECPDPDTNIAFSIPTADSDKVDRAKSSLSGEESISVVNNTDVVDVTNQQNEDIERSQHPNVSPDLKEDPNSSPSVRLSSALSDHSDYSSADSSLSRHSEEEMRSTNSVASSKPRLTVRFQSGLRDDPAAPTVNEIISRPLTGDPMDASVEVKRLRQQIKEDLQKQQDDTQSDIEYLRLRQSLNIS